MTSKLIKKTPPRGKFGVFIIILWKIKQNLKEKPYLCMYGKKMFCLDSIFYGSLLLVFLSCGRAETVFLG